MLQGLRMMGHSAQGLISSSSSPAHPCLRSSTQKQAVELRMFPWLLPLQWPRVLALNPAAALCQSATPQQQQQQQVLAAQALQQGCVDTPLVLPVAVGPGGLRGACRTTATTRLPVKGARTTARGVPRAQMLLMWVTWGTVKAWT